MAWFCARGSPRGSPRSAALLAAVLCASALGSIRPAERGSGAGQRSSRQQRRAFAGLQEQGGSRQGQAPAGLEESLGPGPQFLLEGGAEERDRVPAPRYHYVRDYYHQAAPTAQPASRGQDEQECGFATLPEKFRLVPRVQDEMARMGFFQTGEGATLVQWTQSLFGWSYQNIFFSIDDKAFIKVEVLDYAGVNDLYDQMTEQGFELPVSETDVNTIVLKDCQNVLLYIFREHRKNINVYEVYNRAGQFIAGSVEGINYKDQVHFYDEQRKPIAIAQSPFVTTMAAVDAVYRIPDGEVKQWEIEFVGGFDSNSSLMGQEYRWVLAAAVQVRAIREADWANGEPREPAVFPWFVVAWFSALSVLVALAGCLLRAVYFVVFPRERQPAITNPFLKDFSAYGIVEDPDVARRRAAGMP